MNARNDALLARISGLYPEIDRFGLDVGVDVDQANDALSLSFSKGSERGRTLVDRQDADDCLDRGECLHLGVQVGQFVRNYCEAGCSCRI